MILQGDCLEHMRQMEADSVDSVVSDPPAGIAFMGKDWDGDKGGRDAWVSWMSGVMTECLRVLKPGGHALVWAIPRTSHWTMSALEDAGFEIRDVVTHLFGSGFPKSLDVSKAIDKAAGAEREKGKLKFKGGTQLGVINDDSWQPKDVYETAPATPDAEKWQGFGTALKPACEFWILCRKPLGEKTVAANVLRHGTGALNIDGCRIGTDKLTTWVAKAGAKSAFGQVPTVDADKCPTSTHTGRFPANLVLSCECTDEVCEPDCAVRMLDEQSGQCRSSGNYAKGSRAQGSKAGAASIPIDGLTSASYADSGGASRFFYCAKASRSDRGAGNTHPTVKASKLMTYLITLVTPPGGLVLDPFAGSGSTGVAALKAGFRFVGIEQDEGYCKIARERMAL